MALVQLITEKKEFIEATNEIMLFLGLDWRFTDIEFASRYPEFEHNFIVVNAVNNLSDKKAVIQGIRKQNPLHPIVLVGFGSKEEEREQLKIYSPLYFCKLPFESRDYVNNLKMALEKSESILESTSKLSFISKLISQKKCDKARVKIDELGDFLSEYLRNLLIARSYFVEGKLELALEIAVKASQSNPDTPEIWELIAQIHRARGDTSIAMKTLEQNKEVIEKDIDCLLLLADLSLGEGKIGQSKNSYANAQKLDAKSQAAKTGSFVVGIIDGSVKAIKSDQNAEKTSLTLAQICNQKAIALVKSKQFELAEKLYKNTIELLPDKSLEYKLLMNLGLCMKKAGKVEEAKKFFAQGMAKSPETYTRFKDQIQGLE